jgi:hypothetical protein
LVVSDGESDVQGDIGNRTQASTLVGRAAIAVFHTQIQIQYWSGRMGNNLIQIGNALLLGQSLGKAWLVFPPNYQHHLPILDLPNRISIVPELKSSAWDCSSKVEAATHYGRCLGASREDYRRVFRDHLIDLLNGPTRKACSREVGGDPGILTVHLRSGDLLSSSHLQSKFAPCAFFSALMNTYGFEKLRIVAEDLRHPCIEQLKQQFGPRVSVQSKSVAEDACALMRAENLAVGSFSTFSQTLEMLNTGVKNLFFPGFCSCINANRAAQHQFKRNLFCYKIQGFDTLRQEPNSKVPYMVKTPMSAVSLRGVCDEEKQDAWEGMEKRS